MTEHGKVIDIKDDKAVVRFMRTAACDNCNMCLMRRKDMYIDITVDNKLSAVVDDTVAVQIKEGGVTWAAIVIYGIPLLIMAGAMLLATLLKAPEYIVGLVAVASLVFAFTAIFVTNKVIFKKWKINKKIEPAMLKIVKKGP